MSFTAQKNFLEQMRGPERHVVPFVTTGATVEVQTNLKVIESWSLAPQGSPTVDEVLSLDETVNDDGTITVPSDGNVTVRRAVGTTSGLVFSLVLWGY